MSFTRPLRDRLRVAAQPVVESLECRRLMAGDPYGRYELPLIIEFDRARSGIQDNNGEGTGLSYVLPNKDGNEYIPANIDLRPSDSILRLTSSGDIDSGSAFEGDNTLTNALTTTFRGLTSPWIISARVIAPLTQVNQPHEQGGIIFGPDQDNLVKLAVAAEGGKVGLQFLDEQKYDTGYKHSLPNTVFNIGSFSAIKTLDLYMVGTVSNGTVRALYRINGGDVKQLPNTLKITGIKKGLFFNNRARAGIMVQHKHDDGPLTMTFDTFSLRYGDLQPVPGQTGQISTASRRFFNDVRGGAAQEILVPVRNDGDGPLTIPAGALNISGPNASMFTVTSNSQLPVTLQPGQKINLLLRFSAASNSPVGIKTATLSISSNDSDTPVKNVRLRGLATAGTGGTNEPSLQVLFDLYEIPISVGDSDPDDVFLDDPPAEPNDEIIAQQFRKAAAGNVTITPLAVFGVSSNPALRFGYYEPGSPAATTELFTIPTSEAQTVNVTLKSSMTFDPGTDAFSLYTLWPGFKNTDNTVRVTYQQDLFNSFDVGDKKHIRFYPMRNPDGTVVIGSYIFAVEEIDAAKDNQDFVGIISNVAISGPGPEIGTELHDVLPSPNRMVFNKFQIADTAFPNTAAHSQAKLRVRNSGTSALNISSIQASGPFSVLTTTGAQTVQPGTFVDVTVRFTGSSTTGLKTGTLTINSNDADEAAKQISLVGYHQRQPEHNFEPPLATVVNQMFGYTTNFGTFDQLSNGGKLEAVGDEILSPYWFRANTSLPVSIRQLSSSHTQGEVVVLRWHNKGSNSGTTIFTTAAVDAQSIHPRKEGTNLAAAGTFTPGSGAFGFRIDNEWSDPTKNPPPADNPDDEGHHVRFFVAKDAKGNVIPDAYFMVMDYAGVNYDYNDNVYLISNIRPENP